MSKKFNFANALLKWFDKHGRKNLPWQHPIEPYRVWLSEVMLQQTQVETVIPYFLKFTETFPTVHDLAKAPLDDVLHLWTGLGYYARARNLHKCANSIVDEYYGVFPEDAETLATLPGIGKSTARAITSISFDHSNAILDGNVKRVLARFHAVQGWPGAPKVEKILWQHADSHMPKKRCADYTQAIMDLGATLCKRSKPNCPECPMQTHCEALAQNLVSELPGKKPKKDNPTKTTVMLIVQDQNEQLYMEQRPQKGIWGGLWSFLEFSDIDHALTHCQKLGRVTQHEQWSEITHVFSHYKLLITPLVVTIKANSKLAEPSGKQWVTLDAALKLGLAAPVKKLIQQVQALEEKLI